MGWGLLQGLGQGMQQAANTYGKKMKADAALEKMQAKRKRHLEKIVGYSEEGRPIARGSLLNGDYSGKLYGKPDRPEPVYVKTEDGEYQMLPAGSDVPKGSSFTTEKVFNAQNKPENTNFEWVTNENGDEVYKAVKPGMTSYDDDDDSLSKYELAQKQQTLRARLEAIGYGDNIKTDDNGNIVAVEDLKIEKRSDGKKHLPVEVAKAIDQSGFQFFQGQTEGDLIPFNADTTSLRIGAYQGEGSGKRAGGGSQSKENPDGKVDVKSEPGGDRNKKHRKPLSTFDNKDNNESSQVSSSGIMLDSSKVLQENKQGLLNQPINSKPPWGADMPDLGRQIREEKEQDFLNQRQNPDVQTEVVNTKKYGKVQIVGKTQDGRKIGKTLENGELIFHNGRYWAKPSETYTPGVLEQIEYLKSRNRI